jgi:RecB family exonuclease
MSEHWRPEGYEDTQSEEAAFLQACDILKYYVRSDHTPKGQVLATEAYLTCNTTLSGHTVQLSCRADRVELFADGTLEMLDYKLSKTGGLPSAAELAADLPSFIYFLLLWHSYRRDARVRNIRLAQLNLLSLTRVAVVYEQFQIVRHREALTELVSTVMSGEPLEPRVNAGCSWCPVLASCPAWSELDLADLENFAAWRTRREAAENGQAEEGPQAHAG